MTADDRVKLHLGDCLEVLRGMEAGSVDAVVTDPPYCSGGQFRGDRTLSTNVKYVQSEHQGRHADFNGDTRDQRGFAFWSTLWLTECLRVTRPGGACCVFIDWRQLPTMTDVIQAAGWVWRGIAVWDKTEGCRPHMGRFRSQCEYVVWGTKGAQSSDLAKSIGVHPGVCRCVVRKEDKHHVTGKPTEVMKWTIRLCPVGGKVLDPFAGSGTTGVACALTGRDFIGVELSAEYHAIALRRISAALAEPAA